MQNRKRISISGVQEKYSVLLDKSNLRLTVEKEQGIYILKPKPHGLKKILMAPANEHVTMQIASQIFKIPTAINGLVFFSNSEPAYLTKRFDISADGFKLGKEDFATLAGKTEENAGNNFKYLVAVFVYSRQTIIGKRSFVDEIFPAINFGDVQNFFN